MASVHVGFALLSCRHRWARCWPDAEGKQILSTDVETLPTHIAVAIDNVSLQCILSCHSAVAGSPYSGFSISELSFPPMYITRNCQHHPALRALRSSWNSVRPDKIQTRGARLGGVIWKRFMEEWIRTRDRVHYYRLIVGCRPPAPVFRNLVDHSTRDEYYEQYMSVPPLVPNFPSSRLWTNAYQFRCRAESSRPSDQSAWTLYTVDGAFLAQLLWAWSSRTCLWVKALVKWCINLSSVTICVQAAGVQTFASRCAFGSPLSSASSPSRGITKPVNFFFVES